MNDSDRQSQTAHIVNNPVSFGDAPVTYFKPCTICELPSGELSDTTIDEIYYSDEIDRLCAQCAYDLVGKIY